MTTTISRMLICLGIDDKTIQSISGSVAKADCLKRLLYALHLQLTGKKYLIALDDATKEGDDAIKGDDAFKKRNKWLANLDSPITEKRNGVNVLPLDCPKDMGEQSLLQVGTKN